MKVTVVPAQITTVEDRVAGNLGFSQVVLFVLPIFISAILYGTLPPFMGVSLYKIVLITVLTLVCGVLGIRIKGKIVLLWLVVILRYKSRPRTYLFRKASCDFREEYVTKTTNDSVAADNKQLAPEVNIISKLAFTERARLYSILTDPLNKVRLVATKKGELNVRIIKAEE